MNEGKKQYPDPLVRQRLFPDATGIFTLAPSSLAQALEHGIVVVDTNVLLVPYTTGRASLEQIRQTYERLVGQNRLRIPGQVAREFADNRAEKLKTLYQQLSRKRDTHLPKSEYPFLESLPEYADLVQRETTIVDALAEYRKAVGKLLEIVEAWNWNDPVSLIYRQLFTSNIIVEPPFDRDKLLEELRFRQEHRIPPGYKDASNEYSGVGDLLIWKALLEIGKQTSSDVVFVSGDEKTDWRYQSENTALYPRFELLQEYHAESGGRSLLIISFAQLLEQFGAPAPVVAEVRKEEAVAALSTPAESNFEFYVSYIRAERAVYRWLLASSPGRNVISSSVSLRYADFIVENEVSIAAYEVMYIRGAINRKIRDWAYRAQSYLKDTYSIEKPVHLYLVLVADNIESIERIMRRAPFGLGPGMGIKTIIIGVLTEDDEFRDLHWIHIDEA